MSVSAQMKKRRIYFMKRKAGMIAASFMVMALAAGCGQKEAQAPAATAAPTTAAPTTEAATTAAETTKAEETTKAQETTAAKEESKGAEGGYKTGLAIVSSMARRHGSGGFRSGGSGSGRGRKDCELLH